MIKYRFPVEVTSILDHSRWWEYAPSDLHRSNISDFEQFALGIIVSRKELSLFNPKSFSFWENYQLSR